MKSRSMLRSIGLTLTDGTSSVQGVDWAWVYAFLFAEIKESPNRYKIFVWKSLDSQEAKHSLGDLLMWNIIANGVHSKCSFS